MLSPQGALAAADQNTITFNTHLSDTNTELVLAADTDTRKDLEPNTNTRCIVGGPIETNTSEPLGWARP